MKLLFERLKLFLYNLCTFRIVPTINVQCDALPKGTFFEPFKVYGINHVMIEISKRKVVMVNMGGIKMPFYLSTGKGKKRIKTGGSWFPFFGLDPDGWFNKGSSNTIPIYYGNPYLKQVAEALDKEWGDIREKKIGVKVASRHRDPEFWNKVRAQINVDVKGPVVKSGAIYIDYSGFKTGNVQAMVTRFQNVVDKINKGMSSLEECP